MSVKNEENKQKTTSEIEMRGFEKGNGASNGKKKYDSFSIITITFQQQPPKPITSSIVYSQLSTQFFESKHV